MISSGDLRNGTMFEHDGEIVSIVSVEHIKMARQPAVIKAKLRNVLTGSIYEQSFKTSERFRLVRIDSSEATYSYHDGTHYYFMDAQTYDQIPIDEDMLEGILPFLKEGSTVFLQRYRDKLIGVELPINVVLKVVSTDPGFKGDTVSGASKQARLETGATIQVPLFIQAGDVVRVDTRTNSYMERA